MRTWFARAVCRGSNAAVNMVCKIPAFESEPFSATDLAGAEHVMYGAGEARAEGLGVVHRGRASSGHRPVGGPSWPPFPPARRRWSPPAQPGG